MKFFRLLFILSISKYSFAYPGFGNVFDSKVNIFYTDLKQVWQLNLDGKTTIVVPDVHSQELSIDANDNIYGEHLWYNGERLDTWGHYIWCLKKDGVLVKEETKNIFTGGGILIIGLISFTTL